jgi:AraC-like DNA-binding protein
MYAFRPLDQRLPRAANSNLDPVTGDVTTETVLFEGQRLSILDRLQMGRVAGWGPTRGGGAPAIVFIRSGIFECKTPTDYVFSDPTHVKCYDAAHEFRRQRLAGDGEAYTLICPDAALMAEAFGGAWYQAACPSEIHYRHLKLYKALRCDRLDALEIEEIALNLLADVSEVFGAARAVRAAGPAVRRRLQAAQAFIAADPAADHRLSEVAKIAGCSEFHFARLFRQETGQTLRGYRRRLRTRMALKLISEGQRDLTGVALDCGFNTHSHMTATFQTELGRTPSAAREKIALKLAS